MSDYYKKYLKYKYKYLNLKGGCVNCKQPIDKDVSYLNDYEILDENFRNNFTILIPKTNEILKMLIKFNMPIEIIHNVYILQRILQENFKIFNVYKINEHCYVEIEPIDRSLISFFFEYLPDELIKKNDMITNDMIINIKNILNLKIINCAEEILPVLSLSGNINDITEDFFKSFMENIVVNIKKYIPTITQQIAQIQYMLITNGYKLKRKCYNSFGYSFLNDKLKIYLLDFENIEVIDNTNEEFISGNTNLQLLLINELIDDISNNLNYSICKDDDDSLYKLYNIFNNMYLPRDVIKIYPASKIIQNIIKYRIQFPFTDIQSPFLYKLESLEQLNNESYDMLKTYLRDGVNPDHFNSVKVINENEEFLTNWKMLPNSGNNNCGFYISEINPDKILICRSTNFTTLNPIFMQEITRVLHISKIKSNLITKYYNTYKINNKYYVECERMNGDLTSYFINYIPKNVAIINGHHDCNNVSDIENLFKSGKINEIKLKKIINDIVEEYKRFTKIMIKDLTKIRFELLKLGYACSDNKLDNFGYTLISESNHPVIKIIDYGVVREIFHDEISKSNIFEAVKKIDPYVNQLKIFTNKYFIKNINELIVSLNNNFTSISDNLCMDFKRSDLNNPQIELNILQKYYGNKFYSTASNQVCFINFLNLPLHNFQQITSYDDEKIQPFLQYIHS